MPKLLVLIGSGGGGHAATARALQEGCALAKKDFEIEVLDVSAVLGVSTAVGDALYNWLLASGRAKWIPTLHAVGRTLSSMNDGAVSEQFRAELSKYKFDAVVSCVPFVNRAVANALSTMRPTPPLITIMSDFEHSVDHPWMQDHRQHLVCGTEAAIRQAEAFGHPSERVYGTSGMLVHPSFYEKIKRPRAEEQRELGLNPEWRTVCIFFGGFGPIFLPAIINILQNLEEPLNLLVLCGKNKDVVEKAIVKPANPDNSRLVLVGFTTQVAYYMQLSDLLIGKPGPGVVSEALVSGLPLVLELNEEHTPPQEKAVAQFVAERGLGVIIQSYDELPYAVSPDTMSKCKEQVDRYSNQAVFEVPHIIDGILKLTKHRHRRIASTTEKFEPGATLSRSSSRSTMNSMMLTGDASAYSSNNQLAASDEAGTSPTGEGSAAEGSPASPAAKAILEADLSERMSSISIQSSSYLDYTETFEEPLRLDEAVPSHRIFVNASGRWGHDVIYYSQGKAADPNTIEIIFSAGYQVTWYKELVVSDGDRELHKAVTRNDERGPHTIVVSPSDFTSGIIKLDFFKSGFLGIHTHAYTRYLDAQHALGSSVTFLWARDRFSSSLKA